MSTPYTIRWGILGTFNSLQLNHGMVLLYRFPELIGTQQLGALPRVSPIRYALPRQPMSNDPRHLRIRQRPHDRPLHPLCLRHKTHRHSRRFLILLFPRQTIPRNMQMPFLGLRIRLLRRTN